MSVTSRFGIRGACRLVLGIVMLTATLWGAGFWDKKDFTQWSEREVNKTFTDSPWAKKVTISNANAMQMAQSTGGRGGGGRGAGGGGGIPGGGGGGGGRRGGGGGGGGGMTPPMQMLNLLVRFDEALPVKHAKVKYRMGESTELTPEMQQYLDSETDYYVVTVEGLPQPLARFEEEPERLATTARLRRKGHDDVYPAKVEVSRQGSVVFRYFFVKNDPIELSDKEVEFYFKLDRPQAGGQAQNRQRRPGQQGGGGGQQAGRPGGGGQRGAGAFMLFGKEVKKKFRLKDMVYNGELTL